MKKRIVLGLILASALSTGGWFGWDWWTEGRFVETTDDAYVHADHSPIAARIDGHVRHVLVEDNARVRAGDPLVAIDDADLAARLRQAEAAVAVKRAARATIDDQVALQTRIVRQAEAQTGVVRSDLKRAEGDRDRYGVLARENVASQQRHDYAQADYQKAGAQLSASQAAVAAERQRLEVLNAQALEAEQAIRQAEAARDIAALDLEHALIRAPIDGVVGNRTVTVGQYVKPGTQLMVIVPLPEVYVVANYKETQVRHMIPGQAAALTIDAFPDTPLTGRVESFSPATGSRFSLLPPENATGNFTKIVQRLPVRIALPADAPFRSAIRPGMSVVVRIDTRAAGAAP